MPKPKRVKAAPVYKTIDELDKAGLEHTRHQFEVEKLEAERDAKITEIKEKYTKKLEPIIAEQMTLAANMKHYTEHNRAQILPTNRNSMKLVYGTIGFRSSGPVTDKAGKITWAAIVENLMAFNLTNVLSALKLCVKGEDARLQLTVNRLDAILRKTWFEYINPKFPIDKDAVKKAYAGGVIDNDFLQKFNLKVAAKDEFYYEPDRERIAKAIGNKSKMSVAA